MAAEEVDLDKQVAEYSKLYSIDKWLQPRSMVEVQLAKLKEETRCPMCFGKIRDARISMVCLHRYCAKCIEQYLRAKVPGRHGDEKECPVCRAHLHSRRATKPDRQFDKIIKALYGDVDVFDAEEEALIEADNKAHVKAWQAQVADMKARQAAAVEAAKKAPPPPPQDRSSRKRGWAAGQQQNGGWEDEEDEEEEDGYGERYAYNGASGGGRSAGGSSKGGSKAAKLTAAGGSGGKSAAAAAAAGGSGGGKRSAFAAAAAAGGVDEAGLPERISDSFVSMGSGGAGGSKKKKRSQMTVARMIAIAAQAAAAAGPPARCCVVQLIPEQQQQPNDAGASSSAAAEAAGGGRSRKPPKGAAGNSKGNKGAAGGEAARQPLQQLLPGQVAAPNIDQPYLSCPVGLTVAQLKQQLLQQLQQQGTTAAVRLRFEVQLQLVVQQRGLLSTAAAAGGGSSGSGALLGDDLTVGQLHEQGGCVGPDVQLQYRLVGV